MKKLLREPLLHFLLLGALLFAVNALLSARGPAPADNVVLVMQGQIDSMAAVFERTWQRAPTQEERSKLIEDFIRDEILYREGVALGLDRDDAMIRRRVRQKVELLAEEAQERDAPDDAVLQAYLDAHRARFETEPRVSFRQAYLDPVRSGRDLDRELAQLLAELRRIGEGDAAEQAGDSTQLAHRLDSAPLSDIARDFGEQFAAALAKLPQGQWRGPVPSAYGLHMVLVTARTPARMPELAQVRDAVQREWSRDRRVAASDSLYRELRQRYVVSIEPSKLARSP